MIIENSKRQRLTFAKAIKRIKSNRDISQKEFKIDKYFFLFYRGMIQKSVNPLLFYPQYILSWMGVEFDWSMQAI